MTNGNDDVSVGNAKSAGGKLSAVESIRSLKGIQEVPGQEDGGSSIGEISRPISKLSHITSKLIPSFGKTMTLMKKMEYSHLLKILMQIQDKIELFIEVFDYIQLKTNGNR